MKKFSKKNVFAVLQGLRTMYEKQIFRKFSKKCHYCALLIYSLYKVKDFPVSTLYPVTCMFIAKGFPFFPVKCMSIEKGFPVTEKNL